MDLHEIPKNKELTYIGNSTYRDKNVLFGIKRKDRRQHVYILGKSGTGKSALMFNMIIQNIENGDGVCMVDPHGENVEAILSAIPPHRMKDVVYFNPADAEYHIGFNVLELIDPKYKHLVASGLMGIFTKIWANAWSARMEYILNNAILALLDTPGTTLLGIPRMLVDKDYRQKIISNLKDPVIKAFWVHEYEAWQDKFRNEAIAPIQNKVGQFLSTSIIRNVVGQSKSTINIFDIMNEGKIFLVNVSKGRIGEDNSGLLGGMIITKIQLAAMERVRIPEDQRKDFYLYVDEFQNFVTDAFAGILSEARKYRLNLTVAHQYTAQLVAEKSTAVRDAVFGNVGTMIVFRVGAEDAEFLENEFDPEFTPQDIVNLPNYKVYLKLMIDGVTSRPFSARTLPPLVKSGNVEVEKEVIRSSRDLYCRSKEIVEKEINDWSGMSLGDFKDVISGVVTNSDGSLAKFPIICSACGLEKTVPFKPEAGRPAYCKECIAKIKSGELKPVKEAKDQMIKDEARFYKPLADLGIEFTPSGEKGEVKKQSSKPKTPILSAIKDVFTHHDVPKKEKNKDKGNKALKEVLDKTLAKKLPEQTRPVNPPITKPEQTIPKKEPAPVSLNVLKTQEQTKIVTPPKDRAASVENMNKLKNVISSVKLEPMPIPIPYKPEPQPKVDQPLAETTSTPTPEPVVPPVQTPPVIPTPAPTPPIPPTPPTPPASNVKEVPEDVLRKILE